jgi:hypothetical protein
LLFQKKRAKKRHKIPPVAISRRKRSPAAQGHPLPAKCKSSRGAVPFFFALFSFGNDSRAKKVTKKMTLCSRFPSSTTRREPPRRRPLSSSYLGAAILAGRPIRQTRTVSCSPVRRRIYTVTIGWSMPFGFPEGSNRSYAGQ